MLSVFCRVRILIQRFLLTLLNQNSSTICTIYTILRSTTVMRTPSGVSFAGLDVTPAPEAFSLRDGRCVLDANDLVSALSGTAATTASPHYFERAITHSITQRGKKEWGQGSRGWASCHIRPRSHDVSSLGLRLTQLSHAKNLTLDVEITRFFRPFSTRSVNSSGNVYTWL